MGGSVCKICTWKCKQNVKECPFFTENTDIPVMHFNRQDGIVEWSGRVHTMGDIRPTSSESFIIGASPVARAEVIEEMRDLVSGGSIVIPQNAIVEMRDGLIDFNTGSMSGEMYLDNVNIGRLEEMFSPNESADLNIGTVNESIEVHDSE